MLQFLLWLSLVLHHTSAEFASRSAPHYFDVLKLTCDSLSYRTSYHNSSCYFVIDAESDSPTTSATCSRVLPGAKLALEAPDVVWTTIDFPENEFVREGYTRGKKRAMCLYESRFPGFRNSTNPKANKCKRANICEVERPKLNYILAIQYLTQLKKKVEIGQTFTVKGDHGGPRGDCSPNQWSINLRADGGEQWVNIPLHVVLRYDTGMIHLMTLISGKWVSDDRYSLPTTLKGKPFEIRIRAMNDHFQLFINGEKICTYKYRVPLDSITYFDISSGNGCPYIVQVQMGEAYAAVPTETGITGSRFSYCKTLFVTGRMLPYGNRRPGLSFIRNTPTRRPQWWWANNAMYWTTHYDVGKLVMTDCQNGNFGWEQTAPLPFGRNEFFNLTITNEARGFVTLVNGKEYATFAHRVCPLDIDSIWFFFIADLTATVSHATNCEVPKEKTGICASSG